MEGAPLTAVAGAWDGSAALGRCQRAMADLTGANPAPRRQFSRGPARFLQEYGLPSPANWEDRPFSPALPDDPAALGQAAQIAQQAASQDGFAWCEQLWEPPDPDTAPAIPFTAKALLAGVSQGILPAGKYQAPLPLMALLVRFAVRHHLPYLLAPFQIVRQPGERSATLISYDLDRPLGSFVLYLAADPGRLPLLYLCDALRLHKIAHLVQGGPECCVAGPAGQQAAVNTLRRTSTEPPYPFPLNVFHPMERILLYNPCRLTCRPSADLGRRLMGAVERGDPNEALRVRSALSSPIIFSEQHGAFAFPEYAMTGPQTFRYNPALIQCTAPASSLAGRLAASVAVARNGRDSLLVTESSGDSVLIHNASVLFFQ